MAMRSLGKPKTLVVTSRVPLIKQWAEEMGWAENVEYMCIQSAYKHNGEYDLVIVDEIHRSLSATYRQIFVNVKCEYILGLTATVPHEPQAKEYLNEVCPIIYEKHLDEIVTEGILPQFRIHNVGVPLVGKEKAKYKLFSTQFEIATIELSKHRLKDPSLSDRYKNVFDLARDFKDSNIKSNLRDAAKRFWSGMSMRKLVVYNNSEKFKVALSIIDLFPNKRWLLFTKSIDAAEELAKLIGHDAKVYHSKMKKHHRDYVLEEYRKGTFNKLVAVDALNEGLSVDDVDAAICLSGVSTILTNTQQLGRLLRYKDGKYPLFFNLFSIDTVEKNWVEAKTIKAGLAKYTTQWNTFQDLKGLDSQSS